jgi:hypothetical protein
MLKLASGELIRAELATWLRDHLHARVGSVPSKDGGSAAARPCRRQGSPGCRPRVKHELRCGRSRGRQPADRPHRLKPRADSCSRLLDSAPAKRGLT